MLLLLINQNLSAPSLPRLGGAVASSEGRLKGSRQVWSGAVCPTVGVCGGRGRRKVVMLPSLGLISNREGHEIPGGSRAPSVGTPN